MEPFFQFLGNFWWLIFPLMGVMGGAFRAWERGARRRHERRLEIIRAKGELKTAQVAARAKPLPAPAGRPETQAGQLERLFAAHDDVIKRWLEYELDVAKLIAFPAMSDGRQPLTAAFLRAKKVADNLRPPSAKAKVSREQLADYRGAVTDFEVAFDVAERDARRLKDSSFTESERRRLDTAKQLLTVAIDQAATPAERQLAYRRVRQELDGLISLSDGAIEILEQNVALEITTGGAPVATPGSARATSTAPPPATQPAPPPLPTPGHDAKVGPWPVPARSANIPPGRVIHPKPHP